ncbi:MAG: response regulator transcription factor [Candidatus Latescibacterota bacterium]
MTTIVLADDHHVVREGLRTLLKNATGFHVIGETGDGLAVVDMVERLKPDVLVLDLMMPGLNGSEITRRVRRRSPGTRVVVLSMYDNKAYVLETLEAGAMAYVLKVSPCEELVRAIREVAAGRRYLSPPLSEYVIEAYVRRIRESRLDPCDTLTKREREVLCLAAEGHSSTAIADRLFISPRTAETHRANMMHKLGLHTRTELVRYAIQRGIIPVKE